MRRVIGVLLSALVFVPTASAAEGDGAITVGDLHALCTDPSAESRAACRFYILGVTQGVRMGMNIADGKTAGGRPCVPDDTSGPALESAVKTTIRQVLIAHPNDKQLDASGAIGAILVTKFPCQRAR